MIAPEPPFDDGSLYDSLRGTIQRLSDLSAIKSDQLADVERLYRSRARIGFMSVIKLGGANKSYKQPASNSQLRLDSPLKENASEPRTMGSGIFATVTLVGISIIATELLVIATPSIGFVVTFTVLVLGALLAACMLANAMAHIFEKED